MNARSHPVEMVANPAAASPRAAATRLRGPTRRLVGGVADRLLRLPAPSTDYAVCPMRDGVELAADHYAPTNPTGTLLIRGPYGRGFPSSVASAAVHAARGYHAFTGDVLAEDVYVHGSPVVELAHTSDNPHFDVFVRVDEVDGRGRSRNISDGYRRLSEAAETITVELDGDAHRFRAGTRIRLLVAGGSHPRYARNLGTDDPPLTGTALKSTGHAVHFGTSRLSPPVLPSEKPP